MHAGLSAILQLDGRAAVGAPRQSPGCPFMQHTGWLHTLRDNMKADNGQVLRQALPKPDSLVDHFHGHGNRARSHFVLHNEWSLMPDTANPPKSGSATLGLNQSVGQFAMILRMDFLCQ